MVEISSIGNQDLKHSKVVEQSYTLQELLDLTY